MVCARYHRKRKKMEIFFDFENFYTACTRVRKIVFAATPKSGCLLQGKVRENLEKSGKKNISGKVRENKGKISKTGKSQGKFL